MLLLPLALVLIVGLVAGVMLMLLWQNSRKKDGSAHPGAAKAPYTPVANLFRDPASGKLLVEQDGRILSSALSLNEGQRGILQSAAKDLHAWLGLPAGPQISATRAEMPPRAPLEPPQPFNREQFFTPEPPPAAAIPLAAPGTPPTAPAPAKSIVAQIDEVLQEMLAESNLANSAIRLAEEPRHGVIVWVGLQRHEGIDAVPDEAVRAVIRSAVKEWERRSAAG
jgi:hypothetical protein